MTSFAKQRGASSSRILAFWAVAFCLALSAVQVSAAPDFIRSLYAGSTDGKAGPFTGGSTSSDINVSVRSSAANPTADEVFFFDESGVIAKVANGLISVVSGTSGTHTPFVFNGAATEPISSVTYSDVLSLTFDRKGFLYAVDQTSFNVIRLDLVNEVASVVAKIPDAYSVVPNKDGTALYYSMDFTYNDVFKIALSAGNVVTADTLADTVVGSGKFHIFVVTADETKIYGSDFGDKQFYGLTLATKVVDTYGVADPFPASTQVDVSGAVAVTGGFSGIAFYKSDTQLIISSDAGYVFFYDVAADKFSQISGNGATFTAPGDVIFNGRALKNPTSPFFVSSTAGRIYVDFQLNDGTDYSFFEALDLQTVSITLSPTSVNEGSDATFTITRALATDQPLDVKLSRAGSSATPAADYTSSVAFTGDDVTVMIPAGSASTTLVITAAKDANAESAETVILAIADGPYNIDAVDKSKTLTINDAADGSVEGDPHFVGFEGQLFDFQGHPGKVYNLITDLDIQVNSLFGIQQNTQKTYSGGPILENISIFTDTERVLIQSGGSNVNTVYQVLYGNPALSAISDGVTVGTSLKVSYEKVTNKKATDYGFSGDDRVFAIVKVDYLSAYKFLIYIIENGRPAAGGAFEQAYAHRFLDLNSQIVDTARNPHGVLGQTYSTAINKRNVQEVRLAAVENISAQPVEQPVVEPTPVYKIQGTIGDYEVKDGIFGKVFTYNKFDTAPAEPPADPAPADPSPAGPPAGADPNPAGGNY